jgi:AGCS family alanine or glycine:cation symporter
MDAILDFFVTVNTYLTDYLLIFLLVGVGILFTVRTRAVQIRCFGEGMKQVFGKIKLKGDKKGGVSSFQALATAVAAQVGTGNIVGASGAILVGGPGAIFWMWIIAFLGMSTIYAEATLAQKTKVVNPDGTVVGGPVYYIKSAFKGRFGKGLAAAFAVFTTLALGFMGAMVQSNSVASNFAEVFMQFGADKNVVMIIVGVVVAVIAGVILIGGVKRLASVTEKIVPVMALVYLAGGLFVLAVNVKNLPGAFGMIFKFAFVPQAIVGGVFGAALKKAVSQGAKRGLFSNEAGMGSTPHAHALAEVKNPHKQGVSAMIGVFIDTFVVLTMTALVVMSTLYFDGTVTADGAIAGVDKTNMVQLAFQKSFGAVFGAAAGDLIGSIYVAVCLFFFAFSTIISWNYFGKVNFEYLFGKKSTIVYSVISIGFVFLGAILSNDLVWELTDFFNYLMVIPNVITLVALSGAVAAMAKPKGSLEIGKIKDESTLTK